MRILLGKGIQPLAVNHRQAPAANRADPAEAAGLRSGSILAGPCGIIKSGKTPLEDIADQRGELPAGMDLPIGKKGQEVEGGPASICGATPKKLPALSVIDNIDEIVF